ncbi:MAG: metallophosphoesterase [Clostridia bacterium]|nr:metallophosphoesterase [Clostridia bacterium]MBR6787909.1 metallophosphoesterase [Clostridia bacterium]
MRIGVFSDSHGDTKALDELLEKMGYVDAVCFLGDIARDAFHLKDRAEAMPNHPVFYAVRGNNDYASMLPWDLLVELGGMRIYMTHGHRMVSPLSLAYRALENGAQIALFGHTHEAMCERVQGVMLLNPGSAGNYCRGGSARASLLEIKGERILVTNVTV